MKKPFLLIANQNYFPDFGTGDWVCCFETEEEAKKSIVTKHDGNSCSNQFGIVVNGVEKTTCDSVEIVDLRKWTE